MATVSSLLEVDSQTSGAWRPPGYFSKREKFLHRAEAKKLLTSREHYLVWRSELLLRKRKELVHGDGCYSTAAVEALKRNNGSRFSRSSSFATDITGALTSDWTLDTASAYSDEQLDIPRPTLAEGFVGMHHIFEAQSSTTSVRFAHNNSSILAFSTIAGTICVCNVRGEEGVGVRSQLRGHSGAIVEIDWDMSGQVLISGGVEGRICVWYVPESSLLRSIELGSPITALRLHPINSNIVLVAWNSNRIALFNISTGKQVGKSASVKHSVKCLAFSLEGDFIFAGDASGRILLFKCDLESHSLNMVSRIKLNKASRPVTGISFTKHARSGSFLVANIGIGQVLLLSVEGSHKKPEMHLKHQFAVEHYSKTVRAAFSPALSRTSGPSFVSGSEDGSVHICEVRHGKPMTNTLMAHGSCVVDVSWSCDESLLATCDDSGTVILWKRRSFDKST